jgi:hypothetical protein
MFIIFSYTSGKYVNRPGSKDSFTKNPDKAQRFESREQAFKNCCGDEIPVEYISEHYPGRN